MRPKRSARGIVVGAALFFTFGSGGRLALAQVAVVDAPQAIPTDAVRGESFEVAMVHYENCHWLEAYVVLAAPADRGDGRASQLAFLMARSTRPPAR